MTITQLNSLLEALPDAARVETATGDLVAFNRAAAGARDHDWHSGHVQVRDLGDGWRLCICKTRAVKISARQAEHVPEVHALARGIAHEIRNPLSSILTAINLVRDDPVLSAETAMLLEVVKKEALRMKCILEEFSQYVRPPTPHPTPFDLARAARSTVAALLRDGAMPAAIAVVVDLPETLMVVADEMQLGQVLRQIIANAVEAMGTAGTLRLTGHAEAGCALLCVDDTGPGFSAESLERAFQPFYSKKSQGTGLGLSIAHAAVEAAGGRIRAENRCAQDGGPTAVAVNAPAAKAVRAASAGGARVCLELLAAPPSPAE